MNIAALKKGTRLTDKPKNYMLRVRLDEETLEKLDRVCEIENESRSQIVRKGIEEQYQKSNKKG